jgi:pantetheine-phosphate adenylyltransferase
MDGRVAIYPGSFDPATAGHLDIIARGAALFDRLIVAVASVSTAEKKALFTLEERLRLLREACAALPNVEIDTFSGLLVEYAAQRGARVVVKGLRAVSDFEYEFAMALMNRRLAPHVDTLYLMTSAEYSFLSSSLVKEVARLGGALNGLVPEPVREALEQRFRGAPPEAQSVMRDA